ncbi:39S ribosomal protein L51, mitochondrial [Sorochytrium milnesiophthora]
MSAYAHTKNGVGVFVPQLKKLTLHYCERSGSSRGMIQYLQQRLFNFANTHPHVEIVVTPRPSKHPLLRGVYLNDKERRFCVRSKTPKEIEECMQMLAQASGSPPTHPPKGGVISTTPAIRGIWHPFK